MTETSAITSSILPPENVRKILVCQLRQIGDVLLSTPSIHLLRKRYPNAELHLMTEKFPATMVLNNPDVDKVWAVDKTAHKDLAEQIKFYWRVARERYDLVVDFQQLPRIRWVVAMSRFFRPAGGRQVRLSYDPPWYNRWLYTHTTRTRDGYAAMSKASVLEPLGIRWDGERPGLFLDEAEMRRADAILSDHGIGPDDILVTVDPSHRRVTRQWPAWHYGELIDKAAKLDPRLKFLVLWGPGEAGVAQAVAETAASPACIPCNELISLREMAGCVARAALHLGNCSAPRHIAVAVGTPTLTILGSTSGAWTFPAPDHVAMSKDLDCQPCNDNICPKGRMACLHDMLPETVLPKLLDMLPDACRTDAEDEAPQPCA